MWRRAGTVVRLTTDISRTTVTTEVRGDKLVETLLPVGIVAILMADLPDDLETQLYLLEDGRLISAWGGNADVWDEVQ